MKRIPLLFALLFGSCASYESTVHSRSVAGFAKDSEAGGYVGAKYTVTYK